MLSLIEAQSQVRRMRGLENYPQEQWAPEAEVELIKTARRARSLDSLQEIVDRIIAHATKAPKPSELLSLILGPSTPKFEAPTPTKCPTCGDSGFEPRHVLRTARSGGAGYEVQGITEAEAKELARKVDWQRQGVYSSVRPCPNGCRPRKPRNEEAA